VRSNVNTETCETIDGITTIYEIKNIKEVKDRTNKLEYIKAIYKTTNDNELKLFFQQETHNQIKNKLKIQ
jgi:dihydrodipicolinate synthase/N-acetylneuraminate lyase